MKIITAEQARKLSGPSLEDKIEELSKTIESLAKKGSRSCKTGYHHTTDSYLWGYGGYHKTPDWKRAKELLELHGYKVTFYYKEGGYFQFDEMYTLIEW